MIKRTFLYILKLFRKERKMGSNEPGKYIIYVDDNFHYMDENERYTAAVFDNYQDAVKYCKDFVDKELLNMYKTGMTAEKLYDDYTDFGEDPYIRPHNDDEEYFSAWKYAKEKSKEICKPVNR
jgi:hypothetical protein